MAYKYCISLKYKKYSEVKGLQQHVASWNKWKEKQYVDDKHAAKILILLILQIYEIHCRKDESIVPKLQRVKSSWNVS